MEKVTSIKLVKPLEYKGTPYKEGAVLRSVPLHKANTLLNRGIAKKYIENAPSKDKSE